MKLWINIQPTFTEYKKENDLVSLTAPWRLATQEENDLYNENTVITPESPIRYRVLKDTIMLRVEEAGKMQEFFQVITSLDPLTRFKWDQSSWFHNDNPLVNQGLQEIGCDPNIILSFDPLAPN